jgi:hypothetical protein
MFMSLEDFINGRLKNKKNRAKKSRGAKGDSEQFPVR